MKSPNYVWETITPYKARTVAVLNAERVDLEDEINIEKLAIEYFIQNSIFKQVCQVQKAAQSEREINGTV